MIGVAVSTIAAAAAAAPDIGAKCSAPMSEKEVKAILVGNAIKLKTGDAIRPVVTYSFGADDKLRQLTEYAPVVVSYTISRNRASWTSYDVTRSISFYGTVKAAAVEYRTADGKSFCQPFVKE